jgi:hypothetical protein
MDGPNGIGNETKSVKMDTKSDAPTTATPVEEVVDLSTISWRFEAWLNSFPLNRATVLDYFKHSQFYGDVTHMHRPSLPQSLTHLVNCITIDRGCNNEIVLAQNLDPATIKYHIISTSLTHH